MADTPNILAALDDLKTVVGVTDTSKDVYLTRLLTAASTWFESQVGRAILAHDISETTNSGWRPPFLITAESPVISVSSVTVGSTPVPQASGDGAGWVLADGVIYLRSYTIPSYSLVTVTYRAGWESVPADISDAVITMAAMKYRENPHLGAQSTSAMGQSMSFLPSVTPKAVQSVIDSYRRMDF